MKISNLYLESLYFESVALEYSRAKVIINTLQYLHLKKTGPDWCKLEQLDKINMQIHKQNVGYSYASIQSHIL